MLAYKKKGIEVVLVISSNCGSSQRTPNSIHPLQIIHSNMKQFVCISLALFVTVAMAQPHGYHHSAPSYKHESSHKVHQVSLDELTKLIDVAAVEKYLNAPAHHHYGKHAASYAPAKYIAAASAPVPGAVVSKSYSAAPSAHHAHAHYHEAPAAYHEAPATYQEGPAHHHSYAAPAPKYEAAHKPAAYGAQSAHKYAVLPAFVTQIHAGKHNYKTYQTPIQYSTVTLPVAPAGPVANLYVPEHKHQGYEHSHTSYSGPSY